VKKRTKRLWLAIALFVGAHIVPLGAIFVTYAFAQGVKSVAPEGTVQCTILEKAIEQMEKMAN
jgi:hypothetical protein